MSSLRPIAWRELVGRLRFLGFSGPYQQGKHPFMVRGDQRVGIPNPHEGDVSIDLLTRILRHAAISRQDWESSSL
jgi:predicted RNA binding protein YcfA (HicA-like mRNA interferase family)